MAKRTKRLQTRVKRRPRAQLWNALETAYDEAVKRRPDFSVVYGNLRTAIRIVSRIHNRSVI